MDNALKVIGGESGGRPDITGDKTLICTPDLLRACIKDRTKYGMSDGLFMIRHLPGRPSRADMLDPEQNVKYAAQMLKAHHYRWSPTWASATKQGIQ